MGRWLGAVFEGTLGKILPYINGFVMAIKEMIKTFALFIGYEIPDSTGSVGNILDQMGDSSDDLQDSIGGVNGGLDSTEKKLKKIKNLLSSKDELNIIQEPEDTASSGSGGGGGGTGGFGSIDPRILEALKDYENMMEGMRMKAMDIRDAILGWRESIGKSINDNIFAPISISWDKYGAGIMFNFSSGFNNLRLLAGDFLSTWNANWKLNFQSVSDLFFSLLETGGIVFDTITEFMLDVWNKGGKDLYDSVNELGRAFFDLAKSINDRFVKPFLRWFKNNILPTISDFVGASARMTSSVVGGFAKLIKWIADTKVATVGLVSTIGTFYGAWKIGKLISDFNRAKTISTTLSTWKIVMLENSSAARNLFLTYENGKQKIVDSVKWVSNLNTSLKNSTIFTKASDGAEKLLTTSRTLGTKATFNADAGNKALASSQGILSTATSGLSKVLGFLASNPLVAVVGGLALLSVGITAMVMSMDDGKTSTQRLREEIDDLAKRSEESGKKIEELGKKTRDSLENANGSYDATKKYLNDLIELTGGQNGYVSNIEQAKLLVEKVNEVSADSVSITEDGYIAWQKTPAEIQKIIDKLQEKLKLQVYEEQYVEAMKQEKDLRKNLATATKNQSEAQKLYNDALNKAIENNPGKSMEYITSLLGFEKKALDDANKGWDDASFKMAQNKRQQEELTFQQQAMNGSLQEQAIQEANLSLIMSNKIGKNGELTATYGSLSEALNVYDEKLANHSNGIAVMTQEELTQTMISRDFVIQSLVEKATAHGQSYDTMLTKLKEHGVELSAEETTMLQNSYTNYTENGATLETIRQDHYNRLKTMFQQNGIEMSDEQIHQIVNEQMKLSEANNQIQVLKGQQYDYLKKLLKKHNIDIDSEDGKSYVKRLKDSKEYGTKSGEDFIDNLSKEMKDPKKKVEKDAEKTAKSAVKTIEKQKAKIEIGVKVKEGALDGVGSAISQQLNNIKANIKVSSKGKISFDVSGYAGGGYPSVGELFIANEKGPEMLGTMGGKPAVANQTQIDTGIENASYRGLSRALRENKSSSKSAQPIHIHIGRKTITEVVDEEEEENFMKTGKRK